MNEKSKAFKTLKGFIKSGELPLVVGLAPFFLDHSRKNLEIFRERLTYSVHKRLIKKFYMTKITSNFGSKKKKQLNDNPIWMMWLQGIENAPELSKVNYQYLKKEFPDNFILVTQKNILEFIDLPEYILKKWRTGSISNTHFSDIVRLQLLDTYGGTWIDSTVFVKKTLMDSTEFKIPQTFSPGNNCNVLPVSNWFIHSSEDNLYIARVRDLLFEYWKKYNFALDYFICHHFLEIASVEQDNYLKKVIPIDNTMPHFLMLRMRETILSKEEMNRWYNSFELMKFTNKFENETERSNYAVLVEVIKTQSHLQ